MDVSIRELKNHLSAYLRRVQAGEQLHVTLRGKRIARLSPESVSTGETETAALAKLDALPWIRLPAKTGVPQGAERPLVTKPGDATAEELVRELRD